MREVFLVPEKEKNKTEQILKKDDIVSRQSIIIKSAQALEMDEEGYFIIIDGSEEAIQRAEELIKDFASKYKNKEEVLKRYDEQEDNAISGFGNIIGG